MRGWVLAFHCSDGASAQIVSFDLPAKLGGWVETEFSLYFCFQKTLLALGEAGGAEWFHVYLLHDSYLPTAPLSTGAGQGKLSHSTQCFLPFFFFPFFSPSQEL